VLQSALASDLNELQREVVDDHLRQSRWALIQARNFSRQDRLSRLHRHGVGEWGPPRSATHSGAWSKVQPLSALPEGQVPSGHSSASLDSDRHRSCSYYETRPFETKPEPPRRASTMPRLTATGQLESFSKLNLGSSDGKLHKHGERLTVMRAALKRWFK